MFTVTIEPPHQLMRIEVQGFWQRDTMRAYLAELGRQVDALAAYGGCRRILVNMSDYPIQSAEIAQGHARIVAHGKTEMKAATAVVMKSALSKLQAKRMANLAGQELFDDEPAARRWILAQPVE
jgi:hypothetical protein